MWRPVSFWIETIQGIKANRRMSLKGSEFKNIFKNTSVFAVNSHVFVVVSEKPVLVIQLGLYNTQKIGQLLLRIRRGYKLLNFGRSTMGCHVINLPI
jgi:hypothetical protein